MILSTFLLLGKHHHYLSTTLLILQKWSSIPCKVITPYTPSSPAPPPSALETLILLPMSILLTTLGTSYKWNHVVFVFSWMGCSPGINVLRVHPCWCKWQGLPSFLWLSFGLLCICHVFHIYSPINGNLDYFYVLAIVNNAAVNMECTYLWEILFLFPLSICQGWIFWVIW